MSHAVFLLEISFRPAFFFDPALNGAGVVVLGVIAKICTCCAFNNTICGCDSLTFSGKPFLGLERRTGSSFSLRFVILSKFFTPFPLSI